MTGLMTFLKSILRLFEVIPEACVQINLTPVELRVLFAHLLLMQKLYDSTKLRVCGELKRAREGQARLRCVSNVLTRIFAKSQGEPTPRCYSWKPLGSLLACRRIPKGARGCQTRPLALPLPPMHRSESQHNAVPLF